MNQPKVRSSVITTLIHINLRNTTRLQQKTKLSPATWLIDFKLTPTDYDQLQSMSVESESLLHEWQHFLVTSVLRLFFHWINLQ